MTTEPEEPVTNPETVRLIYEHTKGSPDLLIKDGDDLDSKGLGLLGAASVVLGLASFGSLTTAKGTQTNAVLIALGVAGIAYLFAAYHAARLLRPTTYDRSHHADTLYAARSFPPVVVMESLIKSAAFAYAANGKIVKAKAGHVTRILVGLSVEAVAVVAALIASRI